MNTRVMLTYLTASKLLHLLMDWEITMSKQPALDQVRGESEPFKHLR